jgi:DNA-binding transcriptional LysR family regulator
VDLDGIEVFVKVVQAGSFSRAARLLGMPNSTVSAKVSLLEKRLGTTLLHRTTRKLRLTEQGESYYRRSAQAVEELHAAEHELAEARNDARGLLRLTAAVEIGHSLLPSLVRAFSKKHPQVQIDLRITNRVLDLVEERIDLAIRAGKLKDSRLIARRFSLGDFALWASPSFLRTRPKVSRPEDLARHECLRFSMFKSDAFELTNGKEKVKVPVSGRFIADDFEVLRSLAALGEGITFLPSFLCAEQEKEHKLARVLPHWRGGAVTVSLVYPAQRFVSPKVRAFIAVAEEMLK